MNLTQVAVYLKDSLSLIFFKSHKFGSSSTRHEVGQHLRTASFLVFFFLFVCLFFTENNDNDVTGDEEVQVDKTHLPLGYPEEVGSVAKIFTGVRQEWLLLYFTQVKVKGSGPNSYSNHDNTKML